MANTFVLKALIGRQYLEVNLQMKIQGRTAIDVISYAIFGFFVCTFNPLKRRDR